MADGQRRLDWVTLGTETMLAARKRRGFGREAVARQLHVSAKTYERWEERGEVPGYRLADVAEVLGLEVEDGGLTRVTLDRSAEEQIRRVVREELAAALTFVRKAEDRLNGSEALPDADEQP